MTESSLIEESKSSAFDDEVITDSDEEELEEFDPIPYVFRLKDALGNLLTLPTEQIQNARVICPPYHTLLDHTVAVLWIFYSQKGLNKLNASNIHWALKFLEGAKNKQGNYSPDVEVVIDQLQAALFDITASIDEESIAKMNLESTRLTKDDKEQSEDTKSGYGEFAGGILGKKYGTDVKKKKSSEIRQKIPSFVLSDMVSNMDPEEIENLLLKDDECPIEAPLDPDSDSKQKKSSQEKIAEESAQDREEIFPEELIQWRNQQIQKAIMQLEQIKSLDETLKQLMCRGNSDAVEKIRNLIDKT